MRCDRITNTRLPPVQAEGGVSAFIVASSARNSHKTSKEQAAQTDAVRSTELVPESPIDGVVYATGAFSPPNVQYAHLSQRRL